MGLKMKIGRCIDCDPDAPEKPIYSKKRCKFHYWKNNEKENAEKKKAKGQTAKANETKKNLNIFFASQLLQTPDNCENCGASLQYLKNSKLRKSIIAHILPKREKYGFPEVATHPQNRVFLCSICHGDFDNKGEDFAPTMNCFNLICERFLLFSDQLNESSKQRLPFYFKDLLKIPYIKKK